MLELKTRLVTPALLLSAGIALVGCSASKDGPSYPRPLTSDAYAKFDLTTGDLPYPSDPFFFIDSTSPTGFSTDGTLNLPAMPWRSAAMQAALNSQDGWSTNASITTGFTQPIDPATITAGTVRIVKLWLDPTTKAPATNPAFLPASATGPAPFIAGVLTPGTDYKADVSPDYDSEGKILRITPLKPLDYSKGPAYNSGADAGKILNVGYLVLLTNGIKATDGTAMGASSLYSSIKSAPAPSLQTCQTTTDLNVKLTCFIKPQLAIAQAVGIDPASVILSWSFSTQAVDDSFAIIAKTATPRQTLIVPTGLSTYLPTLNPGLNRGHADVFVGSTQLPYYLKPAADNKDSTKAVRGGFWTADPAKSPDGVSTNVTMFNPMPVQNALVTVPLLVTIPKVGLGVDGKPACPAMPANGWPLVIVQHGITRDRSDALAVADAFADACFIVAAIDLPLHGITDTASPLYCTPAKPQCIGASERTFDLDIVAPTGIDLSGSQWINVTSPATSRDNLRQGEADLITFTRSVKTLAIPPGTPLPAGPVGVDPTRVSFVGLSLGGIVGGVHIEFSGADTRTATLAVPGGVYTKLLLDSATFGPPIKAGVSAQLPPNSYIYNLYFRDFQAAVDGGDPVNHIRDSQKEVPLHLIKVLNDQVVPNSSTDRLIAAAPLTKLTTPGCHIIEKDAGAYTFFTQGSHGSLFDPTASLAATVEMQRETVTFAASAGQCLFMDTSTNVIDTTD